MDVCFGNEEERPVLLCRVGESPVRRAPASSSRQRQETCVLTRPPLHSRPLGSLPPSPLRWSRHAEFVLLCSYSIIAESLLYFHGSPFVIRFSKRVSFLFISLFRLYFLQCASFPTGVVLINDDDLAELTKETCPSAGLQLLFGSDRQQQPQKQQQQQQ